MAVTWALPQLLGYVGTWSAWQNMKAARGDIAPILEPLLQAMARAWVPPAQARTFTFPITLLLGRTQA